MANAAQVLQQAHDLIEAGNYEEARQILDAVRSSNENNPDFWWVYAHAVDDASEGKAAIERVRQLAPNYAGLESLTGAGSTTSSTIKPLRPLSPPPPPMGKAAETEDDEFADTGDGTVKKATPFKTILTWLFLILIIVVVVIAVLSQVLNNSGVSPTPERTAIVDNFETPVFPTTDSQSVVTEASTEEALPSQEVPLVTEEVVETEESPSETEEVAESEEAPTATEEELVVTEEETEAIASSDLSEVMDEIADYGVPSDGVSEEESSLGETLTIKTCTVPGPATSQNIIGILNAFKDAGVSLSAEAIAFNVTDCSSNSLIVSLGISAELVESYWLGDTTASELLAALQRL